MGSKLHATMISETSTKGFEYKVKDMSMADFGCARFPARRHRIHPHLALPIHGAHVLTHGLHSPTAAR
jgi:hypothetical protein